MKKEGGNENQNTLGRSACWAQCLTNLTSNHEVVGSIPSLAKRVKDPVLP